MSPKLIWKATRTILRTGSGPRAPGAGTGVPRNRTDESGAGFIVVSSLSLRNLYGPLWTWSAIEVDLKPPQKNSFAFGCSRVEAV